VNFLGLLLVLTIGVTAQKPYKCTVPGCGKTFADRTNIKRHLVTHQMNPGAAKDIIRMDGSYQIGQVQPAQLVVPPPAQQQPQSAPASQAQVPTLPQ